MIHLLDLNGVPIGCDVDSQSNVFMTVGCHIAKIPSSIQSHLNIIAGNQTCGKYFQILIFLKITIKQVWLLLFLLASQIPIFGSISSATFGQLRGIKMNVMNYSKIYVYDGYNSNLNLIDLNSKSVSLLTSSIVSGYHLDIDRTGSYLYVGTIANNCIYRMDLNLLNLVIFAGIRFIYFLL